MNSSMPTGHRPQSSHAGAIAQLKGYRVLVVEDDYFVAQDLCSTLRTRGATVIGPARSVDVARQLVSSQMVDCALLDINLHGEYAFDFAEELQRSGIRTVFTTGYDTSFIPPRLRHTACLQKPVDTNALLQSIRVRSPGAARP
ncbi:MAG TPA: response regulator [Steroidobacteraceae bacterium]|jgi:DNA-binding response OmpR family regulator|nr:response regulator [Steroidobacteraceae bacterium]